MRILFYVSIIILINKLDWLLCVGRARCLYQSISKRRRLNIILFGQVLRKIGFKVTYLQRRLAFHIIAIRNLGKNHKLGFILIEINLEKRLDFELERLKNFSPLRVFSAQD